VWAHRGDSAHAVENTLEAFERARAAGADGVELDVRLTRDGEVVVFHDDDLERLAGRPDALASLSLAEVREVRLSSGARIPTLAEVLDAIPELEVNVELKSPGAGRAGALPGVVARWLRERRDAGRVIISSFDPWALVQVHSAAPAIATGFLFHRDRRRAWLAPWLGSAALHPEDTLCGARDVRAWRRAGYAVNVWTVDDAARLRELAQWGVDGLISNDPAAARAALSS
jgi:glycerophosphoryl diester phosphodiesterase